MSGMWILNLVFIIIATQTTAKLYDMTGLSEVTTLPEKLTTGSVTIFSVLNQVIQYDGIGGLNNLFPAAPIWNIRMWLGSSLSLNSPGSTLHVRKVLTSDGEIGADITTAYGLTSTFTPAAGIIMQYTGYTADGTTSTSSTSNSFQIIVTSDGSGNTYILMNYDVINWYQDADGNYPSMSFTYDGTEVFKIPGSGTSAIQQAIEQGNSPGLPGIWSLKIDGTCEVCVNAGTGYVRQTVTVDGTEYVACTSCSASAVTYPETALLSQDAIVLISIASVTLLFLLLALILLIVCFKKKKREKDEKLERQLSQASMGLNPTAGHYEEANYQHYLFNTHVYST